MKQKRGALYTTHFGKKKRAKYQAAAFRVYADYMRPQNFVFFWGEK